MRLLHLLGNYKWTGPAEPAAQLAAALARRGADVTFACGQPPAGVANDAAAHAALLGLQPVTAFRLDKHFRLLNVWRESRRLARWIDAEGFDLVHCHQDGDHAVGGRAARGAARRPAVWRTCYDGDPPAATWRRRGLYRRYCDGAFAVSARVRRALAEGFALPAARVLPTETPIDHARFARDRALPDLRTRWALPPDRVVVGIVARLQRHRRFEVLLEALARLHGAVRSFTALIVGRGTHAETVLHEPVRRRGLGDVVRAPGYLAGDDYVAALSAMDLFVFLVPGSDGSCRAVREAQALGLPVVASRRGMLDELVTPEKTGLLADDDPAALAEALGRLIEDEALRRRLGDAARARARTRDDPDRIAGDVLAAYKLSEGGAG